MTTQLDHIILLLSPADFNYVPSWLSDNFTIIDGGKHSRGTSQNKLIIFQDGTYLELFSWIDPQPDAVGPHADFPSWANKPEGHIIDWALTGSDAHGKHDEIMVQLRDLKALGQQLGVIYDPPKEGGRRRMDGKELRWYATRPRQDDSAQPQAKVDVPFFCHDITDRALRVPYTQESTDDWPRIVAHPCGATGISSITVDVPASQFDSCVKLYEGILGAQSDGRHSTEPSMTSFTIASPARSVGKFGGTQCMVILLAGEEGMANSTGQASVSIRGLKLWTSKQERNGERINADDFRTGITLAEE